MTTQQCAGAARHRLEAAQYLYDGGYEDEAISRAYFAAFAVVKGLLLTEGIEPKTHAGLQTMLGLHFVKTQRVSAEMAASFNRLRQQREVYDYDGQTFSAEGSRQALGDAARIVRRVIALL